MNVEEGAAGFSGVGGECLPCPLCPARQQCLWVTGEKAELRPAPAWLVAIGEFPTEIEPFDNLIGCLQLCGRPGEEGVKGSVGGAGWRLAGWQARVAWGCPLKDPTVEGAVCPSLPWTGWLPQSSGPGLLGVTGLSLGKPWISSVPLPPALCCREVLKEKTSYLVTGMQSGQQHEGPSTRHIKVSELGVNQL